MRKIVKRTLAGAFTAVFALAAVGCGESGKDSSSAAPGEATQLTVFIASDKVKGTNESKVTEAVERKFEEDTGKAVKLNFLVYNKSDFASAVENSKASSSWDAAVSYLGIAGVDDNLIRQGAAADLQDYLFEDYCKNIADAVGENISSLTTVTGAVYGIPSVCEQKDYGILVRKDWMRQVGYTDDAAEAESSGGSLKLLKTMGQFENMLKKFKTDIGCTIPLAGAPWDLEYVLTSGVVEGQPSYASHSVIYNADGGVSEVIPGYLHDNYDEVLDYAYQWSKEGLWEQFESTTTYTTREQWFYSEQVGVYVGNPKIDELIRISRRLKEYNPEAELTVIGPLSAGDADGNVTKDAQGKELKGFRAEASAYSGLVINPRSKNQELMLEYLNWVYASKENYELCAYGIEGEDWIRVGEDEFSYPSESYITKPSYSGTLKLLENKNISDRTYTGYTAAEKKWIATARNAECYEDALTGMFLFKPADETYNNFISAQNKMVTEVIYKAWNGSIDPKVSQPGEADGVKYFYSVASDYVDWMTKQYLLNKA